MNNKVNKKKEPINLWGANGIPELDYCGIERAAELIGCKISDLLCLAENRRIEICIKLQGFESSMVAPSELRSRKEWESFVSYNFSLFMMGDVATRRDGLSIFVPKFTQTYSNNDEKNKIKCFYDNNESNMTDVSHCSPIAYLSGLWGITFLSNKSIYALQSSNEIALTPLDFMLYEADYKGAVDISDQYAFSPVSYYLYENGLLDESKLKPITTLTVSDLYITQNQLNRIYNNIGKILPRIMPTEDENKHIKENNKHPKQIKAEKTKEMMFTAMNKALVLYPYSDDDEKHPFRNYIKNGVIIKSKFRELIKQYQVSLFPDEVLPVGSDDAIDNYINMFIENIIN
ncbi:hypothetical protein AB7X03_19780 [Providencia rettgeri]